MKLFHPPLLLIDVRLDGGGLGTMLLMRSYALHALATYVLLPGIITRRRVERVKKNKYRPSCLAHNIFRDIHMYMLECIGCGAAENKFTYCVEERRRRRCCCVPYNLFATRDNITVSVAVVREVRETMLNMVYIGQGSAQRGETCISPTTRACVNRHTAEPDTRILNKHAHKKKNERTFELNTLKYWSQANRETKR